MTTPINNSNEALDAALQYVCAIYPETATFPLSAYPCEIGWMVIPTDTSTGENEMLLGGIFLIVDRDGTLWEGTNGVPPSGNLENYRRQKESSRE